ncbi:MAG: ABC transporter ATP-binding protein [Gemmatimonadetes bacterium]|nr:ABC transporter ATP-binding protein [Gemmatimonadota bacterium]
MAKHKKQKLELDSIFEVAFAFRRHLSAIRIVLAGALFSTAANAVLQIARPWPLKIALDGLAAGPGARTLPLLPDRTFTLVEVIAIASVSVFVLSLLISFANYGQRYLSAKAGQTLAYRLRRDLYAHIHKLSLGYHLQSRSGDLIVRLTSDMNLVRNLLVPSTMALIAQALVTVLGLLLLFRIDVTVGLAAIGIMPLLFILTSRTTRKVRDVVRKQRRQEGKLASTASESVSSMQLVKLHGSEAQEQERFLASHKKSHKQGLRASRLQARLEQNVEILVALGTCIVLWMVAGRTMAGKATPGDIVLAVSYVKLIYRPVRRYANIVARLSKGIVAADRIREVLLEETESDASSGTLRPAIRGRIDFRDVVFAYEAGKPILRNFSLTIDAGETVALVGESGSGKTTVASLVPRLFEPESGEIAVDEVPIGEFELAYLREQISFVTQEAALLGLSIGENIAYGNPEATQEQIEAAAIQAHIHDRILELPDQYEAVLLEDGRGLSGGERQRIALARAFLNRRPIVIFDEPDTFLDPIARRTFWNAAADLAPGRTMLCIVHDPERVPFANRVIHMSAGVVSASGTHEGLLESNEPYRRLFGDQKGALHVR